MTETKKKGRGRPRTNPVAKAKAEANELATLPDNAEKALIEVIAISNVPKKTIESGIKYIEELELKRADINRAIRDQYATLKQQGVATRPLKFVVAIRRWEKDVAQNFAEDTRIIIDACSDMKTLDLFGADAIRKFQAGERDGSAVQAKAAAPNPESAARAIAGSINGHKTEEEQSDIPTPVIDAAPRRASEVVTH